MKHFINLKDISAKNLRKIIDDAQKRKNLRKKLSHLDVDKDAPLKGKLLIQMFEKSSLRTRLSFLLKFFLFRASLIIFLRSLAEISFKFMKCFILAHSRTYIINDF